MMLNLNLKHLSLSTNINNNLFILSDNSRLDIKQFMDSLPCSVWTFWKDTNSIFRGCNNTFSSFLGMKNSSEIDGLKLSDLKILNRFPIQSEQIKELETFDQQIFDCLVSCEFTKKLYLLESPVTYIMNCKAFPIINDSGKIMGHFCIGTGFASLMAENTNIFNLVSKEKINFLLREKKYVIKFENVHSSLTKRETECLLYTMKGKTAKQLADEMNITQKTAEGYLITLKNKLGCYSKSELISIGFESNLLDYLQDYKPLLSIFNQYADESQTFIN